MIKQLQGLGFNTMLRACFARRKDKEDRFRLTDRGYKKDVEIQEKYRVKSAQLYDEYLKTRERPALSLDNYQIHYSLIIERLPIFFPYTPERFNCYKTNFGFRQRTNNLATPPKELQLEEVENIWGEHERSNIENITTHRNTISKTEVYEYSENSRYWKLVDPSIQDPHSIQTYSSDNVFLIVKGENGKWRFPQKMLLLRDNHEEIFINYSKELFNGTKNPHVYMPSLKPFLHIKTEDETLTHGIGIRNYFYRGISTFGYPVLPNPAYVDFAWVPKPLLASYFDDEYFSQVIRSVAHMC